MLQKYLIVINVRLRPRHSTVSVNVRRQPSFSRDASIREMQLFMYVLNVYNYTLQMLMNFMYLNAREIFTLEVRIVPVQIYFTYFE